MLSIYIYGHPLLRKKAKEIDENYENLSKLIENMYETMYKTDGIGLAAPQVGKSIKLFILDLDIIKDDYPECEGIKKIFINPNIIDISGQSNSYSEGCLSIPGINEDITRKDTIIIEYYDEKFKYHKETFKGFQARVIQHEYDHLIGKMFIDYCSPLRKRLLKRKLTSISKGVFTKKFKHTLAK